MANIIYIATSLDGYIARKDGNIDWLLNISNPDNSDFGFSEFIKGIDAVIMGRNTFNVVAEVDPWPYAKPVFVLSSSLKSVPSHLNGKVEIISGEPPSVIRSMYRRGFRDLYIDGGKTIQDFIKQDMIDEMIITKIPVVLGSGIPLFGRIDHDILFEHIETEIFKNGLVKSRYRKKTL